MQAARQIATTVGRNIAQARADKGLTQRDLAEMIGGKTSPQDVSRWERGVVEPGRKNRPQLAALLFDGDLSALYEEAPNA